MNRVHVSVWLGPPRHSILRGLPLIHLSHLVQEKDNERSQFEKAEAVALLEKQLEEKVHDQFIRTLSSSICIANCNIYRNYLRRYPPNPSLASQKTVMST